MALIQHATFKEATDVADQNTRSMAWQGIWKTPDGLYVYYGDFIGKPATHNEAMAGRWTLVAERFPHTEHLSPGRAWTFVSQSYSADALWQKHTGGE